MMITSVYRSLPGPHVATQSQRSVCQRISLPTSDVQIVELGKVIFLCCCGDVLCVLKLILKLLN